MKTVTSVSGGKSSAYIAANYPSDFYLFALVCIEDRTLTPKDKKLVQIVSDKIGREFIATAEHDTILHTILDLEQYIGQEIEWLTGPTFEQTIRYKNGFLPSPLRRYCTQEMKIRPMFEWFYKNFGKDNLIVETQIGFRHGEQRRAKTMLERCNEEGVMEYKGVVGHSKNGRQKWKLVPWQIPTFPLIKDGITRDVVEAFWKERDVRFAPKNNCVGCFHQTPLLLRKRFETDPEKMEWFARQERERTRPNDYWTHHLGCSYDQLKKQKVQMELGFEDFTDCDSGYCGL